MKLKLTEFSSKQFTYNPSTKMLVGDASEMRDLHLQRIYDDACDLGFAVKSETTGNVIVYVMEKEFTIGDNNVVSEIEGWEYTPSSESMRKFPECIGTKALIAND